VFQGNADRRAGIISICRVDSDQNRPPATMHFQRIVKCDARGDCVAVRLENATGVSADFPALVGEAGQTICMAKKA
jgi:hypothetical protein